VTGGDGLRIGSEKDAEGVTQATINASKQSQVRTQQDAAMMTMTQWCHFISVAISHHYLFSTALHIHLVTLSSP